MSGAWARAWRCVVRKPRRSLLMVLLMIVVFTALVAGTGVRSTMHDVKEAINTNVGAGFAAHSDDALDRTQAEQLAQLPQVSQYSLEAATLARPTGATPVTGTSGIQLDPRFSGDLGVTGASNSALHPAFQGKLYQLVAGNHVGTHQAKALIHREFARRNALGVGSQLKLTHEHSAVSLTVAGIFDGKTDNPSGLPSGASENQVFTDLASAQQLGAQLNVGRYFTARADQLPAALQAAKQAAPNLTLEDNAAQFASVVQAISGVDRLLTLLLLALCAAGACVLTLVSTFWVRGRIHEIGILLSIGNSKANIVTQLALEAGIFALIAAVIATALSQLLSARLGHLVLASAGDEVLAALHPTVHPFDVASSLGLGCLVVFVGVSLGILPIIRQRPQRILSQLS